MKEAVFPSFKKTFAWFLTGSLVFVLVAPILLYQHAIGLVGAMPGKPANLLSKDDVAELWSTVETCSPEECASVTPYWIYRWWLVAFFNDNVRPVEPDVAYENMSRMAARIAIYHMRNSHFEGKGMLWWHLSHTYLSIWLQRNWSAAEIATKYSLINS